MSPLLHSSQKADDDEDNDDIETRSPKRSRHGLSVSKPTTISWRIPGNGSIYSIMRRNSRKALYVDPIAWTSDHVQNLDCSFNRQSLPKEGGEVASLYTQNMAPEENEPGTTVLLPPDDVGRWKHHLILVSSIASKKYTVEEILEACDIRLQRSDRLSFEFNHQDVAQLPTDGIFMSSAVSFNIAFITFDTIKELRESFLRLKKIKNPSVFCKTKTRLRLLEPPDQAEDPYLIALLIALAQAQRRHSQIVDATQSFKVKLLAVQGYRARHFYVYTATIPTEFLNKLDEPSRYFPSDPISVSYHRFAVKNDNSLERLRWLLCADSCKSCGHAQSLRSDIMP